LRGGPDGLSREEEESGEREPRSRGTRADQIGVPFCGRQKQIPPLRYGMTNNGMTNEEGAAVF